MKIALGTVQFGMNYGITNSDGKVNLSEVSDILDLAKRNNVNILDTAISYGDSESILGQFDLSSFSVISKIPSISLHHDSIYNLINGSLSRLNISSLYGFMFHNENDVFSQNCKFLYELKELKEEGLVDKIGASFYSPELAIKAVESGMVDIIQVPSSQLDHRFCDQDVFKRAESQGVEVHARSLFLQGLLAVNAHERPIRFKSHPDLINYDKNATELGLSNLELALAHLESIRAINYGVLGFASSAQFKETLEAYRKVMGTKVDRSLDLASHDDVLLDPSKW